MPRDATDTRLRLVEAAEQLFARKGVHQATTREVLEMLEMFGTKVIPEFDPDPVHSTTRYRETAKPKFARFTKPVPEIDIPVLPTNALIRK